MSTPVALIRRPRSAMETAMEFATRSADRKEPQQIADVFDKALDAAARYEERTNTGIILTMQGSSQRRLAIILLALLTAGAGAAAFVLFYFLTSALGIPFLVIAGTSGGFIPVLATQQNVTTEQAGRLLMDTRKALGGGKSDDPRRTPDPPTPEPPWHPSPPSVTDPGVP